MAARQYLALTRAQALALRTKLNAQLGYPRTPTDADLRGGGPFVPHTEAVTTSAVAITPHPSDGTKALVELRGNAILARLTGSEALALLDARPLAYEPVEPVAPQVETKPDADTKP